MYQIFSAVKTDSLRHFNNLKSKSHIIITTSDVLVGPKIQTCFTPAHLTEPNDEPYNVYEWIGNDKLREKLANKCFSSLHSTNSSSNHFSFLMALQTIHHQLSHLTYNWVVKRMILFLALKNSWVGRWK